MDHETAVRLEAAERYLLGQLSPEERDGFEEHYFTCPSCAEEVRETTAVKNTLRGFWRSAGPPAERIGVEPPQPPAGFLAGLSRPAFLVSACLNAVLVLFGVYHFVRVEPRLRQMAWSPQYLQEIPLLGVARSETLVREVQSGTSRLLITGYVQNEVSQVFYEFRDLSGKLRLNGTAPAPPKEPSSELHLTVPINSLTPGDYEVTVRGIQSGSTCLVGEAKVRILAR